MTQEKQQSSETAFDAVRSLTLKSQMEDPLRACIHCGFCLEACPTYQLSGDENNSPRGRLLLWRSVEEKRIPQDDWVDYYTNECIGCLACETVCPANVPYEHLLETTRKQQVASGRVKRNWKVRWAAKLVQSPGLFEAINFPIRLFRRMGVPLHKFLFSGQPALFQSTADYAREQMAIHQPKGPKVALLTGCLMEAVFREINFATVDALIAADCQLVIPKEQTCCGALHEHTGLSGHETLSSTNHEVFNKQDVETVLTNSAGCGLSLQKTMKGSGVVVEDVLQYLSRREYFVTLSKRPRLSTNRRLYVDLPCHLVHGQKVAGIPEILLNATGLPWELAPNAKECCGSGGVYNIEKPENAEQILRAKASFINEIPDEIDPIIVTANHVCMMQWNSAQKFLKRPFKVQHLVQLLSDTEIVSNG